MTETRRLRRPLQALAALAALVLAGCAATRSQETAAPELVTVPELVEMAVQGTPGRVMYGEVQRSGTVYRLTPAQRVAMSEAGVPAGLLGDLQLGYEHAIRANPSLATSDEQWHEIGGFWYGGLPFGWPREWVAGGPPLGGALRRGE